MVKFGEFHISWLLNFRGLEALKVYEPFVLATQNKSHFEEYMMAYCSSFLL